MMCKVSVVGPKQPVAFRYPADRPSGSMRRWIIRLRCPAGEPYCDRIVLYLTVWTRARVPLSVRQGLPT